MGLRRVAGTDVAALIAVTRFLEVPHKADGNQEENNHSTKQATCQGRAAIYWLILVTFTQFFHESEIEP